MTKRVKYNAAEMELLLNSVVNVATALEALCGEIEPPVRQLTSDDLLTGDDTEAYKEAFRAINISAINARTILSSLNQNCKAVAESMGLTLNVVRKSAEETAQDMQKIAEEIKKVPAREIPNLDKLTRSNNLLKKKGGRPRVLNESQKNKILELYSMENISKREIAKQFRVSEGTIRNFLKGKKL